MVGSVRGGIECLRCFAQGVCFHDTERDANSLVVDAGSTHRRPVRKRYSQVPIPPTSFPELCWDGNFVEMVLAVFDRVLCPKRGAVFQRPVECRPINQTVAHKIPQLFAVTSEQVSASPCWLGVGN